MRTTRRSRAVGLAAAALLAATAALASPGTAAGEPLAEGNNTPDYQPTPASLNSHPVPEWFSNAKFGIFIHWGAYSVPAWGPRGSYAEWYWNYMNSAGSPTYNHHRDTYGEDLPYDAFIGQWKAEKYNPKDWVKLFNDAGAKYFVLTSKHHEGMSLWNSQVSGRDAVDLGPKRDLAGDLFKAARDDGKLKAGFYYSLYEWYNPSYTGRPVTNPYTGAPVPYTGAPAVQDYVGDYMLPQMQELIDGYDPDILWCDGQWEKPASYWKTAGVLAEYYNKAKNRPQPKEVAVANRCKIETGSLDSTELDFQTPEYTVKPDIDPDKWEASRGIAHSYGYNQNEPEEDYLTSDELVDSLADIVSKNGNLLLDIGPRGDGSIPELMQQRLRDIGAWLRINGEAIYGTTYWNHAEQPGSNARIRYTTKNGALYATALDWPGDELVLGADLPVAPDSRITLLGSDGPPLRWHRDDTGRVVVSTPAQSATKSKHAYVFKISTPGVSTLLRSNLELPAEIQPGEQAQATLRVTNTGSTASRPSYVAISGPDGITANPGTLGLRSLKPGETTTVPVGISVAADAAPGTYPVTLRIADGRLDTRSTAPLRVVLQNVALGKDATQKSTGYDAPASRAVDGNTDGAFFNNSVTHTAEPETEAWWQVDLGASHAVDSVDVWNRTDCCSDRLKDFWVLTSEQPITTDSLAEALATPGVTAVHVAERAGRPTVVDVPDGTTARYVRVQLASTSNPLTLAEVQVRGR
ncbi:MAG TPA: alpha-L-fucosidase [Kribbellaceae bacterium]|nr:alpha-L-fucosidase [Kribbellaceae bacterium]